MKNIIALIVFFFCSHLAFSQMSGPSTGTVGLTSTFTYVDATVYAGVSWVVSNGSYYLVNASRSGNTYTGVIIWYTPGPNRVTFVGNGGIKGYVDITINCPSTIPTPNASFSYTTPSCGNVTITRSTTSYQWYWQTSPTGTSTANATTSFTATTSGTYYLRQYCNGAWSAAQATNAITVNPTPTVSASNQTICSGGTTSIVLTNNIPSVTNTWTISGNNVSGASASSQVSNSTSPYTTTIAQTLTNVTNANGTLNYTVTPSANGCSGSAVAVTATVSPIPTASATGQNIISGSVTNIPITNPNGVSGTTYTWSVSSSSNVSGAMSGSGTTIAQTLNCTNGTTQGTVTYSVTPVAAGCQGTPISVIVNVYPAQMSGPSTGTVGLTSTFTYIDATVYGAVNWNVSNGSYYVVNTNRTGNTYTCTILWYTPGANTVTFMGDGGLKGHVDIMVNCPATIPVPAASFTYSPSNGIGCGSVVITRSATSYQWYWQTSATGTATTNNTTTFTATISGIYYLRQYCNGSWSTAQATSAVTVKTIPTVIAANQTICSGSNTSIVLTNNIASVTNTWTTVPTNVTGASNSSGISGSTSPFRYTLSQQLTASTNSNGNVVYTVTPSANGCTGTPITVTATVGPLPTVSASNQKIFSSVVTSIPISNPNSVSGTIFNWTSLATNATGASSGTGNNISQRLYNADGVTDGSVKYTVTPRTSICQGTPIDVIVTIFDLPVITASSDYIVKGGSVSLSVPAGYDNYQWSTVAASGNILLNGNYPLLNVSTAEAYQVILTKQGAVSPPIIYTTKKQFDNLDMNYVVVNEPQVSGITTESSIEVQSANAVKQRIVYFDGVGRQLQSVETQNSPGKRDVIIPFVYDDFDREAMKYLAYTDGTDGRYKTDALIVGTGTDLEKYRASKQYLFYQSGGTLANDQFPYSESRYEKNPLNRINLEGAAGSVWQPSQAVVGYADIDFFETWSFQDFLTSNASGGGNVSVTIKQNVMTVSFSAGFMSTTMKTGAVKHVDVPDLYDVDLGSIASGKYHASIKNGFIYIDPIGGTSEAITGFSATFTVNLTTSGVVDRVMKKWYDYNSPGEVLMFTYSKASTSNTFGTVFLAEATYYSAGQLHKTRTIDEHKNETFEFFDKEDRVILRKIQSPTGYAQTYYIYDDFGNLICVLQPEGVKSIVAKLASSAPSITWTNLVGVSVGTGVNLNKLTNNVTSSSAYGSSAATSTEILYEGQSGWVQMTALEINKSRMIGLSATNKDNGSNIDFAMELAADGNIYVWEAGTKISNLGAYAAGTVIKIERNGNIKYYVDGAVKQVSYQPTANLIVDVALMNYQATINAATCSFGLNSSLDPVLTNFAFRYVFDGEKRLIQKQIPGTGTQYLVYDGRDRLVMTQDANQRASRQWLFSKYDALNRPVLTGQIKTDVQVTQIAMQDRVNTYYNSLASNGGAWYETFSTTGAVHGYGNFSYPKTDTLQNYLTVTYYDKYDFKTLYSSNSTNEFDFKPADLPADAANGYAGQVTNAMSIANGQVTGTKTKSLSANTWYKSVNYYDSKYRVVQTMIENPKGHTVTTNEYDFTGKVLRAKSTLYTGQPVQWTSATSVQITGENIAGTSTTNWAAGAISSQILPANTDGWIEFTVAQTAPAAAFGFSITNTNNSYTTCDYQWYLSTTARPYEKTAAKGSAISVYQGDVLRIERINGIIYYKRNGLVQYVSAATLTTPSTTALIADLSFYNAGSVISKARLSPTFGTFVNTSASTIVVRNIYDHAGRLVDAWHKVDNNTEILLTKNIYNELGQLIDKKLHSTTTTAADAKQSLDYRYNIRGWLTSINNSTLTSDATNDDNGDYFGMNLFYEQPDANLGSTALYNGNISGMRWSANLGQSSVKENGYQFSYDVMNRLTAASSRMNKNNLWQTGYYDESITNYDLNGNIINLQRKGDGGALIDNLTYNYGTGATFSNKLLYVTDGVVNTTDKVKGFNDGNTAGNDYTYDVNGNMLTDKNKGITGNITYNHLNLPAKVVRSNSSVDYLYDAGGIKLGQLANFGGGQKFTEYVGPWVFENNELQFMQHPEGRIVLSDKKTVYSNSCDVITDMIPTANVTLTPASINGEKYVQVNPAVGTVMSKLGVSVFGSTIPVVAGERYVFRVKGYSNSSNKANLYVAGNGADLLWPGSTLPQGAVNESWIENAFVIPTGITQITIGVLINNSGVATSSSYFYLNELELNKMSAATAEYQYYLKDHLGNVRLTFTTKPQTANSFTATFEDAAQSSERVNFNNYPSGGYINTLSVNAHGGNNSELLNGGYNGQVGLAKSFNVMPGDVVQIQAYATYGIPSSTAANYNTFVTSLLAAFNLTAPAVGETGTPAAGVNTFGNWEIGSAGDESKGDPLKAFVTIILFDKNYNFIDVAYQASTSSGTLISKSYTVREPGYAYLYISNEHPSLVDMYFDDITMSVTPSPIISTNEYYPFGLTYNSFSRENTLANLYQYNSKEKQDELDLSWLDYGSRMYMPEIARWGVIDPLSEKMRRWSPYVYAFDNPTRFIDPDGKWPIVPGEDRQRTTTLDVDADGVQKVTQRSQTIKITAVKQNGKIVGYTKTTTRASATNTIRVKEADGKKTWTVTKGNVSVSSQTEHLDANGKVTSADGVQTSEMSQSEYKSANDQKGGNSLYDLETTSDKVADLSTKYQDKYHTIIMNLMNAQSQGKDPLGGEFGKGAIAAVYGQLTKNATGVAFVQYHSTTPEGAIKPLLIFYSNQNTGQHFENNNIFQH
jgi:RHS repeat-associated protein